MPKVSIGFPVYNGERFLREALDSILAQTFTDFDVLLYDNASTDNTETICREYAGRDARIRYHRHKTNLGAGRNYNLTFLESTGQYFKWAAHDDVMAPTFLEKCVEALDKRPETVLVFPRMMDIDDDGNRLPERVTSHIPRAERGVSPKVHQRFRRLIRLDYTIEEIFGLIRSDVLRKTKLFLNYSDSDRTLLAELALYGPIFEVPEMLFFHRMHKGSSVSMYPTREERGAWFDPKLAGKTAYPRNRQVLEYFKMLFHHPIGPVNRFLCFLFLANYIRAKRSWLWMEITNGVRRTFTSPPATSSPK